MCSNLPSVLVVLSVGEKLLDEERATLVLVRVSGPHDEAVVVSFRVEDQATLELVGSWVDRSYVEEVGPRCFRCDGEPRVEPVPCVGVLRRCRVDGRLGDDVHRTHVVFILKTVKKNRE
jgi:hypothetical protein